MKLLSRILIIVGIVIVYVTLLTYLDLTTSIKFMLLLSEFLICAGISIATYIED